MDLYIESVTSRPESKLKNEDFIGSFNHLYRLFDGASVPDFLTIKDQMDANWYMRKLNQSIIRQIDLSVSLPQILEMAILEASSHLNFSSPSFE